MWICLNDAFFSIVRTRDLPPGHLLVRARRQGDIERYFPGASVTRTVGRDYLYRAQIPSQQAASVLAGAVAGIAYDNFKDSVRDPALHDAYFGVWRAMGQVQNPPPYSRQRRDQIEFPFAV